MPNPIRKSSPTKPITTCALLAAISIVQENPGLGDGDRGIFTETDFRSV